MWHQSILKMTSAGFGKFRLENVAQNAIFLPDVSPIFVTCFTFEWLPVALALQKSKRP
jgi:hypothetical protein